MLLGSRPMQPGLTICGGQIHSPVGIHRIAEIARDSNSEIIHLDFAIDGDIATLRDIVVVAPRGGELFAYTGCRLAQRPSDRRAVIVPRAGCRGHFRVQPREIVHVDTQPADLFTTGVEHAAERLRELMLRGVSTNGQFVVHERPNEAA